MGVLTVDVYVVMLPSARAGVLLLLLLFSSVTYLDGFAVLFLEPSIRVLLLDWCAWSLNVLTCFSTQCSVDSFVQPKPSVFLLIFFTCILSFR